MTKKLRVISPEILDQLRDSVEENLERYISGDFKDIATENGWDIDVDLSFDEDILAELDGKNETPEVAVSNSMIVSQAFLGLAPNLAAEERVWTRLCHLECLKYARERWLVIAHPLVKITSRFALSDFDIPDHLDRFVLFAI
jgi:hypothetical protein